MAGVSGTEGLCAGAGAVQATVRCPSAASVSSLDRTFSHELAELASAVFALGRSAFCGAGCGSSAAAELVSDGVGV
ncbi:hypothetical protein GCM10010267_67040 [Streptomyces griseorubens]|nr:hypothetical protein GCM10010267_67040 [Streptomyces griseorubens]